MFKALADQTRRSLLDALRDGPATTGSLCAMHPEMSRYGVMDHLRVLHDANLITVQRQGRTRWNHLNPVPIREVYARWVQPIAEAPAEELLAIKAASETRAKTTDVRDRPTRRDRRPAITAAEGRSA